MRFGALVEYLGKRIFGNRLGKAVCHRDGPVEGEEGRKSKGWVEMSVAAGSTEGNLNVRYGLPSCDRCCVLGTLGSGFTAGVVSLAFLLRFSPVDLASLDLALSDEGWTEGLAEKSFGPLSGLDGFDEEARLWWRLGL